MRSRALNGTSRAVKGGMDVGAEGSMVTGAMAAAMLGAIGAKVTDPPAGCQGWGAMTIGGVTRTCEVYSGTAAGPMGWPITGPLGTMGGAMGACGPLGTSAGRGMGAAPTLIATFGCLRRHTETQRSGQHCGCGG